MDIKKILDQNSEQIDKVYHLLADDESKKVFRNVLLHRAVHDLKLIWDVYDEHQYFGNRIVKQAKGCFVDCGAFQGDTLEDFLGQVGTCGYRYFAFEADYNNYEILKRYCIDHQLENVSVINLGVWDKKDTLYFKRGTAGDVSGMVLQSGQDSSAQIQVDSIDGVLSGESIDFIKMDIEGAEIHALHGAAKSIAKSGPVLAVSAYHKLEHLWLVPLLIREIDARYKIYFGHHMWNQADTVCYGILKG